MKSHYILFLIGILLITFACETPKAGGGSTKFKCNITSETILTNECEDDFLCTYERKENSNLAVEKYDGIINSVTIKRGDKWVFKIQREYDDNPNIADDEFKETIQFAIPPCEKSFHYTGNTLKDLKPIYGSEAYSRDRGFYLIEDGCLEGIKQNDGKWLVHMQFKVTTRTNREIKKALKIIF